MKLKILFFKFVVGVAFVATPILVWGQNNGSVDEELAVLNFNYYQTINKNPKEGLKFAEQAFVYFNKIDSQGMRFKVASNYITALFVNENYKDALKILKQIESLKKDKESKALYFTLRGLVENDLNHITEAEINYQKALEQYSLLNDKANEFTILNNLGVLYNNIGDYKRSLKSYLSCIEIINTLKIKVDLYKYYLNVGIVSFNLNDYVRALKFYNLALNEAEKNAETLQIFRTYEKIGEVQIAMNHIDKAFAHYTKALDGFRQLGLKKDECNVLLRLGNIYDLKNDGTKAYNCFDKALVIATKNLFSQEFLEASLQLAIYFRKSHDLIKSEIHLKNIIQQKQKIANQEILKDAYFELYTIEKKKNNKINSLTYLEQYLDFDKKIQEKQLVDKKEQIKIQYTLKQKEFELERLHINLDLNNLKLKNRQQQIEILILFSIFIAIVFVLMLWLYSQKKKSQRLLSIQNEKINIQNKKLISSNVEIKSKRKELSDLNQIKDQLLSIIAHDVKSPITDLNNLIFILRHNIVALDKEDLKKNFAIVESNISNLLNLLNNILNWTINQSSGIKVNKTEFSLNELIQTNLNLIESSIVAKDLTINFDENSNFIIKTDYNIVNFALRNILSNAAKFTNKKGVITLKMVEKNNGVEIQIADTGIGFNEEIHKMLKNNTEKVPTTQGTNKEKGYGIGLSLCKKMLAKINSEIVYEKNDPVGSIFTLILKQ